MSDWKEEMRAALGDFLEVARLAGRPVGMDAFSVEFFDAPHIAPSGFRRDRMAIYGFWLDESLKVGMAGPKSQARYDTQHYNIGSAMSTLAASVTADPKNTHLANLARTEVREWLLANCSRVNVLISAELGPHFLALLEAFLHVRLSPRYEGRAVEVTR